MTRPIRIEFPGGVYHITSRGNAKQRIFADDEDYRRFFSILGDVAGDYGWQCYAYCLMPNHYHLVLTTPTGVLSRGMRQLNAVYAQRFHCRHNSVGHVFQGRFKSILVDREPYLLEVCRYVVLNPVRAGLVKKCETWRWSSYLATVGRGPKPSFLASEWLLEQFGRVPGRARGAFAKFVEDGRKAGDPWEDLRGGVFLGDEAFVSGFSKELAGKKADREFPLSQRLADRPPLSEILTDTESNLLRGQQILQARDRWGYRITEISRHLHLHRNTVAAIAREVMKQS
jgi:REP element-mobilizing transposase RayT